MNSVTQLSFDVVVVGAGPAGIAAGVTAAQSGRSVAIVDDNPQPGGQIWRGGAKGSHSGAGRGWFERLAQSRVQVIGGARVFSADKSRLEVETDDSLAQISFGKLILATGARELFLPFPGWTLSNVMGAGGLQALVKSGLPIAGKRVVLAGAGPLLLAVAAYLSDHGADVVRICEQAPFASLAKFGLRVLCFPQKAGEALVLRRKSRRGKYLTGSWVVAAMGKHGLEAVRISHHGQIREIACDYLGCGFHLVPNTELAQMRKCRLREGFVETDEFQETSQPGIYCAGEPTGIGGMELAAIEGQIAGYAASNCAEAARRLFRARARYWKLARAMKAAFRLRPELATLATADTLLCRCEDVSLERVRKYNSWRAAKLHTRCGMGPCQGRICGAAASVLFGWNIESTRPPIFPVRCSSLAAVSSLAEVQQSNGGRP